MKKKDKNNILEFPAGPGSSRAPEGEKIFTSIRTKSQGTKAEYHVIEKQILNWERTLPGLDVKGWVEQFRKDNEDDPCFLYEVIESILNKHLQEAWQESPLSKGASHE